MSQTKYTQNNQSILSQNISFGKVSLTEKAVFAKHLATMLKSGLTLAESLVIAQDAARGKLKKVLGKVIGSVESGTSFSKSLAAHKKVFSGLFIHVVSAGEASGTLVENLDNIADQLKKEQVLVSKIKSAMTYPAVVMIAAVMLGLGMAYYVLPQIVPLFTGLGVELPLTTRMVIWFARVLQEHGIVIILSIIGSGVFIVWIITQRFAAPVTHWLLLHIPVLSSLSHNTNLTRFSLTLGTLLRSGLQIDEALSITRETLGNFYYRRAMKQITTSVQQGAKLSQSMQQADALFPKLVLSMVRVGEESGRLDETLVYLSEFYETEVDTATKTLTTALEPILLIGIGVVVATLALAIITPIYEITGNLRQ